MPFLGRPATEPRRQRLRNVRFAAVVKADRLHLDAGEVEPGYERRQQPRPVGHQHRVFLQLRREHIGKHPADGFRPRVLSLAKYIIGLVRTADSTAHFEQPVFTRSRLRCGAQSDPDRVDLQPPRSEHRREVSRRTCLADSGAAGDQNQASP